MDNLKLDLSVAGNELVVRHGNALPLHEPNQVTLIGTIIAPGDFVDKRNSEFKPLSAHVNANYKGLTIELITCEADDIGGHVVTGTLTPYPDLAKFFINATKQYSHRDLYDMLKFMGVHFKNKDDHTAILSSLKKFEAKVNMDFQKQDDFKGSQALHKLVEIKTNLALEFNLFMPLFAGEEAEAFKVDICVDSTGSGVMFWLESIELHERILEKRDEIFDRELDRLKEYVIIKNY